MTSYTSYSIVSSAAQTQTSFIDALVLILRTSYTHNAPWTRTSAPLVSRDIANVPDVLGANSLSSSIDSAEQRRVLIGVMSCVGSLLFISIFLILLWRHRNVGAVDSRGEICIRVERGVTVVEQSNTPKNGLRSMFLPSQLQSTSARWSMKRESMILPIHSPPLSLLQSQAETQRIRSGLPSPLRSAYIPIAPPRVTRSPVSPPGLSQYHIHYTKDLRKGERKFGTIIIHPPRDDPQSPRSPPPTYAQSTNIHSQAFQGPRKDSLPTYY